MIIATCSFARFTPDMGVPVCVILGDIPAGLPYKVRHNAVELAPEAAMGKLTYDDFARAYRRKLMGYGTAAASKVLRGILLAERADLDTTAAVLLTATDLTRSGAWCHRTMLASWLTEHMGTLVAELGGLPADGAYLATLAPARSGTLVGGTDEAGTVPMF